MQNEIKLTESEIEGYFEELGYPSPYIEDILFTRDTLQTFKTTASNWDKSESIKEKTKSTSRGHDCLIFENVHIGKGQPKRDVYVIDFGTVRASVTL